MYNEITRKLTSLTLMTVMLAGGLTFAIPGMEPVYAANEELSVSAEVIGNFAGIQVIEIVVDDPQRSETSQSEGKPNVEINSDDVLMAQGTDGIWYGYVVNRIAVEDDDNRTFNVVTDIFGATDVPALLDNSDAVAVYSGADVFLDGAKTLNRNASPGNNNDADIVAPGFWPFIQAYNIADGSDVTIQYGSGSLAETVVLDYDYDDDKDLSLDRSLYPQNSEVHATIDDSLLNLSPTGDDLWVFGTDGTITYAIESGAESITQVITEAEFKSIGFEEGPLGIQNDDGVVSIQDTEISDTLNEDTLSGVIFKTSDTDDNIFVNYDSNEKSSLIVLTEGEANLSWTDSHSIVFDTFNAELSFLTLTSEWLSGIELGLELTDEDRNLNSRIDEDMLILDGEVPFIKVGSPVTIDDTDLSFNSPATAFATGTVTLVGVQNGETVTINSLTYTGVTGNATDNTQFSIDGGDDVADATALVAAITSRDTAVTATNDSTNIVTITAAVIGVAGNAFNLVTTSISSSVSAANLAGGIDGYALTGTFTTSKVGELTASAGVTQLNVTVPWTYPTQMDNGTVFSYVNFDFSKFNGPSGTLFAGDTLQASGDSANGVTDISNSTHARFLFDTTLTVGVTDNAYFDVLNFGQLGAVADSVTGDINDNVDRVNDAIYRFQLEETEDNTAIFEGDVEYIMINQINIFDQDTYDDIVTADDSLVIIVNDDLDNEDSIRVTYSDIDSTATPELISVQEETNTHSGTISLDKTGYSSGNTITVTLEDADLNTDSETIQIYDADDTQQWVGDSNVWLVQMLIDDVTFSNQCQAAFPSEDLGLADINFSFIETDEESGVFTGTLKLPANHCVDGDDSDDLPNDAIEPTNGLDLEFEYQDYSDASGEPNETSSSVSIRSNTGSVSLDRTVYPVPFNATQFPVHETVPNKFLPAGDTNIVIRVNDPDFNVSASGEDTMPTSLVSLKLTRGSLNQIIALPEGNLVETAPDSGIFEIDIEISQQQYDGLEGDLIEQGDILSVEYSDPADASGDTNTVTDSAAFDLRNGVMQTDKSVYIIGSDAIITLIEPDLNLDSETAETHDLDLINWDSDAGDISIRNDIFNAEPFGLRETGDNSGIFQVIIEIPEKIIRDRLERGEEIELEYIDHGPAGANFVGDDSEDITVTIYTSNFGATIELDQKVYTWTDKVFITIVAPDHNFESDAVDEIGVDSDNELTIRTRDSKLDIYKLVETGTDTGIFTGEVILTGYTDHDADGDGTMGDATGEINAQGPTSGKLPANDDDGLTVSFEFSEDENVYGSALIRWNIGEIQWLEASYPATGTGIVRVIDPDMNWNPESVDSFAINVWSDTASGGINLDVTETNEATGIFEGTVFFTVNDASSGARLAVSEGDTITAEYEDNTLPDPYSTADELDVTATAIIGTIVPPLERAPAANLRTVDAFGNSLDTVQVDQQVQVTADLQNGQDRIQAFAYLLQVQNEDGVTVSLSWIAGDLAPGQQFSPAASWIPTQVGTYDATVFVWESVKNPTALSPQVTTTITVN